MEDLVSDTRVEGTQRENYDKKGRMTDFRQMALNYHAGIMYSRFFNELDEAKKEEVKA